MLNTFRADVYRLLRGKALYVACAVLMVTITVQLLTLGSGTIGVSLYSGEAVEVETSADEVSAGAVPTAAPPVDAPGTSTEPTASAALAAADELAAPPVALTASSALLLVMTQFQVLIFFALVIIYMVSAVDFNSGAIQNTVAAGLSRARLYASKLITSFLFIELFYVMTLLVGILVWALVDAAGFLPGAPGASDTGGALGTGETLEASLPSLLRAFGAQSLMVLALASVGTALIFITRKGAALNAIYLVFFMGMTLLLSALSIATGIDFLSCDFILNSVLATAIDQLPPEQVVKMFAVAIAYLVLSTALGLAVFRKAEIR